jgi:excisionase family DNA binding protein
MSERILTTKEAARFLGMSAAFLERDRWAGARIPFIRVGSRAVRYEKEALEAYISSRRKPVNS